jgi:hypothetical protein
MTINFTESGNTYGYTNPWMRIKGIVTGSKRFIVEGQGHVFSKNLNYLCGIVFSPGGGGMTRWFGKPADRDEMDGEAFEVHPDTLKKFLSTKEPRKTPKLVNGKNLAKSLFKVAGKWSGEHTIGDL